MRRKSIKEIIYSSYIRAALLPILVIELTLLAMYFGITGYIEKGTEKVLLQEAMSNIGEIASRESKNINSQMETITELTTIAQKENERFFAEANNMGLPNGVPEFKFAPDKTYYKTKDNGGGSLWYSGIVPIGEVQKKKALASEAMDPIFKWVYESNPNNVGIYFNSFDSMNRYYPFIPDVYKIYEPKMNIPKFNFYYLADLAHNPSKKAVWTEVYLDPAGKGWMASCIVPIYNPKGFLEGVTGLDITIDRFVTTILNLKLPWHANAFLVDQNGTILAMPTEIESILGLKELRKQIYTGHIMQDTMKPEAFNLLKNKNTEIANQMHRVFDSGESVNDFTLHDKQYFLAQSAIKKTGWKLMILVDKDTVFEPARKLNDLSRSVGMLAFAFMVLFYFLFFTYLMIKSKQTASRIALPISYVAERTSQMRENIFDLELNSPDKSNQALEEVEEIHQLVGNFAALAEELRRFYLELDEKVKLRTQELEQANLQIIQQEKMASIGQLAAGIAHEINNPMGFVISNISVLGQYSASLVEFLKLVEESLVQLDQLGLKPEEQERISAWIAEINKGKNALNVEFIAEELADLIEDTLEGTSRVKNIVQELRTFSRLEIESELADINKGMDSVINIIWNELKYKVELKRDYGELPEVQCNIGQLNQVFLNLLMNAVQAIEDHGEIDIRTWVEDEMVKVSVSDTGAGIPEEIRNRIFEPFFTTKAVGSGTGLGLSISYDIMKKHGGSIAVESMETGGTTFIISIPIYRGGALWTNESSE